MSDAGDALAAAAERLVGTPFRLHGRDPARGVDCIGLADAALAACGRVAHVPVGYGLRNASIDRWLGLAAESGLVAATGAPRRGDLMLTAPGPGQHHLMIALGDGMFVHAHAGLRRVVRQRCTPPPAARLWRLDEGGD